MLCAGVGSPEASHGLYVTGWLKRGPTGVIGTNLIDAEVTVASIMQDQDRLLQNAAGKVMGGEGLKWLLESRGVKYIDFNGWERIDTQEIQQGRLIGKTREKLLHVPQMLVAASNST